MKKSRNGLYRRTRKNGSAGAWVLDTVIKGKRYIRTFDRALNLTRARESGRRATKDSGQRGRAPGTAADAEGVRRGLARRRRARARYRHAREVSRRSREARAPGARVPPARPDRLPGFERVSPWEAAPGAPGKGENALPKRYAPDTARLMPRSPWCSRKPSTMA